MNSERTGDLFSLAGMTALVTGASRGLGREIALAYARYGADVIVASRKLEACESVAAEIEALGRRAFPFSCHVGRWEEIDALVEAAYAEFGQVDVLVNNAGMSPLAPSSAETEEALVDKVLAVNFKGPFRLGALVGKRMVEAGGGAIINVSSFAAQRAKPAFGPYAASKAGMNALTQIFALEYGPTVRVNTLSAGPFLTDIADHWPEEARRKTQSAIGRPGQPEEVVTTALYLASPHSSFVTGGIVRVDGGLV
jgi:NAD(P)-dependent dehydrogenase (short-subunit alcohol dehydrogenase family)